MLLSQTYTSKRGVRKYSSLAAARLIETAAATKDEQAASIFRTAASDLEAALKKWAEATQHMDDVLAADALAKTGAFGNNRFGEQNAPLAAAWRKNNLAGGVGSNSPGAAGEGAAADQNTGHRAR